MATRTVYPPSTAATKLAGEILEYCATNGLDATVSTPNGDKVIVSCILKAQTVYKVRLNYIAKKIGYIEGQVMINEKAAGKKTYWILLEKLAAAGFRMGLTVENTDGAPAREHFTTEVVDDEGYLLFDENDNQVFKRIDIIKIKTATALTKPTAMFHKFFDTIIDFEQIERTPISRAPTTEAKLSVAAPAWVPREVPLPTAADWAPLPSRATASTPAKPTPTATPVGSWADEMVAEDDDAEMTRLREQLAKLEQKKALKNAEAERQQKLEAFKAQQAAALVEFEKSLL